MYLEPANEKVSFYAIERFAVASELGGADEEGFDLTELPFDLGNGTTIEDVRPFIAEDEFNVYRSAIGTWAYDKLERLRYAIVHRFPRHVFNENIKEHKFESDLVFSSRRLVRETAACLRLIRPLRQSLHFFEGRIDEAGRFTQIAIDTPVDMGHTPHNQRQFVFRLSDAKKLRQLLPTFQAALGSAPTKFSMALNLHESGFFQQNDWKAHFFLWTAAIEALFTSEQNQGSEVAKERIKFFLGSDASIYPEGELNSLYNDPKLTVKDILDDLYCLRNHIAHGDPIPDIYFKSPGRAQLLDGLFQGEVISKADVLFEAMSFIIRFSLLRIVQDGLASNFVNSAEADAFFARHHLSKRDIKALKMSRPVCPS